MRLKELRQGRKLRQIDVALAIGIDRTTYVKYENQQSEPSIDILKRIAGFYGVSIDYLVGFSDLTLSADIESSKVLDSKNEMELIDIYRQLNTSGQSFLLKTATSLLETPEMRQEEPISSMG